VRLMTMEKCRLRYLANVGECIGEGGVFIANHLCTVGEVVVRAEIPFPVIVPTFYFRFSYYSYWVASTKQFSLI
jgi:hypothetical protein